MSETNTIPAEANAAAETATANVFAVGQTVKFKGYAVAPNPGEPAPFVAGDILTLQKLGPTKDGECYEATRVTDGISSTAYFDEIESYTPPEAAAPKAKAKGKLTDEEKAKRDAEKAATKAKKEAEAAEKARLAALPPPPLVLTESVKALVAGDDIQALTDAAKSLSTAIDTNEFTLGGVLAVAKRDDLYAKLLGPDQKPLFSADKAGFEAYINANLSCGYRKAQYLINMYEKYSAIGVTEQEIAKVGWTKAVLMMGAITPENKAELLEFAENNNKTDVEAKVKSMKVNSGTETGTNTRGVRHAFGFNLYNNDGEHVKAILAQVVETLSPEDRKDEKNALNKALLKMATEWSQFTAAARAANATPAPAVADAAPPAEAPPATPAA